MIVFHLPGGVPVYRFSLALGMGASLGLAWMAWRGLSLLRADLAPTWQGIRLDIWGAIVLAFASGTASLIFLARRNENAGEA